MDDRDLHEKITRLEIQIEELTEASERCQKIIVISKFVATFGGLVLIALMFQAIRFDPIAMIGGMTALVGGTVVFGSNTSTLKQTKAAMNAAHALRTELISELELRVVE